MMSIHYLFLVVIIVKIVSMSYIYLFNNLLVYVRVCICNFCVYIQTYQNKVCIYNSISISSDINYRYKHFACASCHKYMSTTYDNMHICGPISLFIHFCLIFSAIIRFLSTRTGFSKYKSSSY